MWRNGDGNRPNPHSIYILHNNISLLFPRFVLFKLNVGLMAMVLYFCHRVLTQIFYSTIRNFTNWTNWNSHIICKSLYLIYCIREIGRINQNKMYVSYSILGKKKKPKQNSVILVDLLPVYDALIRASTRAINLAIWFH